MLKDLDYETAVRNYITAVVKGIIKVMSKMGISTIASYRGAQIFEAVGLNRTVIDKYFTWTASRVEGIGIAEITDEALKQHAAAFPGTHVNGKTLDVFGQYQYRKDGELHLFNPKTILFFVAFLPQFVNWDKADPQRQFLILGAILVLLGFLTDSIYAIIAGRATRWIKQTGRKQTYQYYIPSAVYLGLGAFSFLS